VNLLTSWTIVSFSRTLFHGISIQYVIKSRIMICIFHHHYWQSSPFCSLTSDLIRFLLLCIWQQLYFAEQCSQPCVQPQTWRNISLYLCPRQWHGGPVIPPGTGFFFHRLRRLAGLRWRYFNPPPRGKIFIFSHIIYKYLPSLWYLHYNFKLDLEIEYFKWHFSWFYSSKFQESIC
jgi:hypothetical protein